MFKDYKIIANTAAGRRRYMQYLIPQVVTSDIVDRYDVWVNTANREDICFLKMCADAFPKINLIWQPEGVVNGIASINAFYKFCCDEDSIYVKLDDDLIWLEQSYFDKMAKFRYDHPEYFVVSPLVINNMLCTYILYVQHKLNFEKYFTPSCFYQVKNGKFATKIHEWFLDQLERGIWENLYCMDTPWALCRFSINSISWFGKSCKEWGGVIFGDDEEFLSVYRPAQLGMANCVNGNCLCSHFAFFTQRDCLDKTDILARYGFFLEKEWQKDFRIKTAYEKVKGIMCWIDKNRENIAEQPLVYRPAQKTLKQKIRNELLKVKIPMLYIQTLSEIRRYYKEKNGPRML